MAMNVGSYYAGGGGAGAGVFSSDRLYGSAGAREIDNGSSIKFDTSSCPAAGYASTHGFDATVHGYQGQLGQHPVAGLRFSSYGPFDSQPAAGGKTSSAVGPYPAFNYAPCGQPPSTYPAHPSLGTAPSRYLHDANNFDSIATGGNDVISQYGGRHFGTAAMMAAAAVATMGGQHHSVGPASCPTLPIYPWMRSMGAGIINTVMDSLSCYIMTVVVT